MTTLRSEIVRISSWPADFSAQVFRFPPAYQGETYSDELLAMAKAEGVELSHGQAYEIIAKAANATSLL